MTRFPYDRFAKDYLQELLSPLGSVETSKDVAGEVLEVDVYFLPREQPQIDRESLGLLGRFAQTKALIEPFRNPVTNSEVGKGRVQKRAIEELLALDVNNPFRSKAMDLLANLKTTIKLNQNLDIAILIEL
ncbi:hypothetical protein [Iningainema tapete]|uniref:Uncharacterized protein n=1 Tax=Iningainema tapete BLCC-T55 TaxID=2748662 RepID=A0A8J6XSM0_9CYAN|nr:hypothetical protein [Iningainema tapete]MBD2778812.1 hypothetical protein [Iningainema tapete BLCC-T55]